MDYRSEYVKVRNYIDGKWVETPQDIDCMPIFNPSTGEQIGEVPLYDEASVCEAVESSQKALKAWRDTKVEKRAKYLFDLRNKMVEYHEELAHIIARDQAKHISDARGEVARVIQIVENACGLPNMLIGEKFEISANTRGQVVRQPLGVVGALSPFNFPALVFGWYIPYAIGCGNTIVYKASEQSPIFMQRMMEIFEEIGLPPGVVNLVNGDYRVGDAILNNEIIRGVCFVGSTKVGQHIAEVCAQTGKRSQVLAGAKNGILVLKDCNRPGFLAQLQNSAFGAAGQRCMAGSNVFIEEACYDEMIELITEMAGKVPVGDALDPDVYMGPVISDKSVERIDSFVDGAVSEGARLVLDGRNPELGENLKDGYFVKPTILADVTPSMTIAKEEVFGPVLSLIKVKNFQEGVDYMNASRYGNGGTIFTQNGYYAESFLHQIDVGMAGVNIGVPASMPYLPFGGNKASLLGSGLKAQGHDGIEFFTTRNVATIQFFEEESEVSSEAPKTCCGGK